MSLWNHGKGLEVPHHVSVLEMRIDVEEEAVTDVPMVEVMVDVGPLAHDPTDLGADLGHAQGHRTDVALHLGQLTGQEVLAG